MDSAESENDKSFRAFLKFSYHWLGQHATELHYFGEWTFWLGVGGLTSWALFPNTFAKAPDTDLRGFLVFIPFFIMGLLRGIYVLWKDDD